MMELNTQKMEGFQGRYKYFLVLLAAAFFFIVLRLWYLQVIKGNELHRLSENNRVRLRENPADRGMLLDRKGRILVHSRPSFEVSLVPEDVRGNPEVLQQVAELLQMDRGDIVEKLKGVKNRPPFRPVKIKSDIAWDELALLEGNRVHLPGLITDVRSTRAYNYGPLAAHLIGYIGEVDENDLKHHHQSLYRVGATIGKYGVESAWESYLRGMDGGRQVEVDAHGREIKSLKKVDSFPGHNLVLTIDLDVQKAAEEALQGMNGALVAMDPNTGRILAMVSKPAYDPSLFAGNCPPEDWKALQEDPFYPLQNRNIQGIYPPGSVFKIITALSGLESGIITPKTQLACSGAYPYGNRDFRCWKEGGHGTIDLRQAIVSSCDIYFYQVGLKVGVDRIARIAETFGLGRRTGIRFPHEKSGTVPSTSWKKRRLGAPWYSGETLSLAVGQGYVMATPLQLVRLIAAVANGGTLYLPQVVEQVHSIYGTVLEEYPPVKDGTVQVSKEHLDFIRDALKGAVNDPHGTGAACALKEFAVGGKTGTAQVIEIPQDFRKGDMDRLPLKFRDHAWFVAFAPVEEPRIAVTVLVEHGGFGGSVAAPVAKKVIQKYLSLDLQTQPLRMSSR